MSDVTIGTAGTRGKKATVPENKVRGLDVVIPRRIFHWINLISISALIFSGIYIHRPFAVGTFSMGTMRTVHFISMWAFAINAFLRLYWAFFGKYGDWRLYLTPEFNANNLKAALRHYFLYEPCPVGRKCDIIQNVTYTIVTFLVFVQIATGFLLYYPENQSLASVTFIIGGLALVRELHFFLMWVFITFTIGHIYLVFAQETDKAKLMFFGIKSEEMAVSTTAKPKVSELKTKANAKAKK